SLSGNVKEEKIKRELKEIKTINIELDHRGTKLVTENEHLKQTYKQLYDSIKSSRVRSKEQCDDLIKQVNIKSAENSDLNASLQEKVLVGISHEASVARSSQQNDVVERHEMTPTTISLELMHKPSSSRLYVPPLRHDWDLLFQPLFDELLTPPLSVDPQAPEVIAPIADVIPLVQAESTGLPSSTTVDQDAPSPSKSQTTPETQSFVIPQDVKEDIHDIEVAHMGNDPLFGVPILEVTSAQSSSTVSPHTIVQSDHQSMMGKISFFLGLQISQSPRGIFINQSKYALESLKKYGFESCDPVDTPMVEKSKLDEDKERKAVDPSHYHGMIGTLLYLTANRPDLQFAICMCARILLLH
nr:uncharacterized mitochondrial protein AtMg00810-like [Tanacetum cinerariifolium]